MTTALRRVLSLVFVLLGLSIAGCGGEPSATSDRVKIGEAQEARTVVDPGGPGRGGRIVIGKPVPRATPGPVPFGSTGTSCGGTSLEPNVGNRNDVAWATVCLLNVERVSRGLPRLRRNSTLALAALRHSRDMVRRAYFSHDSRSGADFVARIRDAGYLRRARAWRAGENLAWGSGTLATPAEIVAAWMASPGHRANVLERDFRDVGVGIAIGAPRRGIDGGATYSSSYGFRS